MNNVSRAFNALLGRDKETPKARAFRHERESIMISLFLQAISGLCIVLALILLFTGSIVYATKAIVYSLLAFAIVLFLTNAGLKWHQNKYGGD